MVRDVAPPPSTDTRVVTRVGGRAVTLNYGRLRKRISVYKGMETTELMILLRTVLPLPTEDYVALEVTREVTKEVAKEVAAGRRSTKGPRKEHVVDTYPLSYLSTDPDYFCSPNIVLINILTAKEAERRRQYRPPPPSVPWYHEHFLLLVVSGIAFLLLVSETLRGFSMKIIGDGLQYATSALYMSSWSLYRFGPGFDLPLGLSIGFWGGAHHSRICGSVTATDQTFWLRNDDMCQDIVRSREMFFITWAWVALGSVVVALVVVGLCCGACSSPPSPPPARKHRHQHQEQPQAQPHPQQQQSHHKAYPQEQAKRPQQAPTTFL